MSFLDWNLHFFSRWQSVTIFLRGVLSTAFSNYLDRCLNSYFPPLYSVYALKSNGSVLGKHYALDTKCLVDL